MKDLLLKCSIGLIATGALTACGGGTNTGSISTGSTISSQFIDAAVSNLQYTSFSHNGVTDAVGNLQCSLSEVVTFNIGSLKLGTSVCQRIITPQTLAADITQTITQAAQTVTSASGAIISNGGVAQTVVVPANPNDPGVVNRVRLLLTMDTDSDPTNGIQLPALLEQSNITQTTLDYSNTSNFDNTATAIILQLPSISNRSITDFTTAQIHFNATLQSLPAVTTTIQSPGQPISTVPIGQYYDDASGAFDEGQLENDHPEFNENNHLSETEGYENEVE